MPIKAFALNRTLKPSGKPSSTDAMIGLFQKTLAAHGVGEGRWLPSSATRAAPTMFRRRGGDAEDRESVSRPMTGPSD